MNSKKMDNLNIFVCIEMMILGYRIFFTDTRLYTNISNRNLILTMISTIILSPIIEEIICRFLRLFIPSKAVSIIFALSHLSNLSIECMTIDNIGAILGLYFMEEYLSAINIYKGIAVHSISNCIVVFCYLCKNMFAYIILKI